MPVSLTAAVQFLPKIECVICACNVLPEARLSVTAESHDWHAGCTGPVSKYFRPMSAIESMHATTGKCVLKSLSEVGKAAAPALADVICHQPQLPVREPDRPPPQQAPIKEPPTPDPAVPPAKQEIAAWQDWYAPCSFSPAAAARRIRNREQA